MCCSGRSRRIQSSALPAVALRGSITKSVVISDPAVCSGWLARAAQVLLALVRQERQQLLRQRVGELREHVGGLVGLDLLQHLGGALDGHLLERRAAQVLFHLLQRVGGQAGVERGQHGGALARADLADDLGDVGGVQLGQLGERLDEVEPREPQRDEVDVLPGHEVAALPRQAAREEPQAEAPRQRRGARVHAGDHQVVLGRLEHHVLHAHERLAAHVEHLVVEQRVDERELVRAQRRRLDGLERDAEQQALPVDVDLGDLRPRGGELPVVAVDEEGGDDGRVLGGRGDHVAELADLHAGGVEDLDAVELGEGKGSGDLVHEGVHILSRTVPCEDTSRAASRVNQAP